MPTPPRDTVVLLAVASIVGCGPRAESLTPAAIDRAPEAVAQAAFAQLRRLEGTWEGKIASDTVRSPAQVTFFVTAKGTAVVERIVIEDPVEMVSVYYLDSGGLLMAHYCAAGNQPRMMLGRASRSDSLRFVFAGGTGFDVSSDMHMHAKQVIMSGPDRLRLVWETFVGGRSESVDTIVLNRVRG